MKTQLWSTAIFSLLFAVILLPGVTAVSFTFPTVDGIVYGSNSNAGTAQSVNLPGTASASVLYLVCYQFSVPTTATWPAGWVKGVTATNGNQLDCVYKFSALSDSNPIVLVTGSLTRMIYASFRISGIDTASGFDFAFATGTSSNPAPPILTVTPALTRLWVVAYTWSSTTHVSYPINQTDNRHVSDGVTGVEHLATATRNLNSTVDNPGTATLGGSVAWVAETVSIRPGLPSVAPHSIWIIALELAAYLNFLFIGLWFGFKGDNIIWLTGGLLSAGMIMVAVSIEAWTLTSSLSASLSLAMVAVVTLSFPVILFLKRMMG